MRTLGEYLIEDGVLTRAQVDAALARQREIASGGRPKRFGEVLREIGLATEAQVQAALDRQERERT